MYIIKRLTIFIVIQIFIKKSFLNTIKAENEFHTFVLINNEKYKMTKIDYLNKKINITNEIKKKFDQQKLIKILNNDLSIN